MLRAADVDRRGALRIVLRAVDVRPGGGVEHETDVVGHGRRRQRHVPLRPRERHDAVGGELLLQRDAELAAGAGDEDAPVNASRIRPTGARSLSGSHQSRFAPYHSTVARDAVLPRDRRLPAELAAELRRVEEVAAVVARPVGDDRLERLRLAGQLEDEVRDLLDRLLDARADVVRLADAPALEHELDRAAVVVDVEPLAPVLRRRVQRQLLVVDARAS